MESKENLVVVNIELLNELISIILENEKKHDNTTLYKELHRECFARFDKFLRPNMDAITEWKLQKNRMNFIVYCMFKRWLYINNKV